MYISLHLSKLLFLPFSFLSCVRPISVHLFIFPPFFSCFRLNLFYLVCLFVQCSKSYSLQVYMASIFLHPLSFCCTILSSLSLTSFFIPFFALHSLPSFSIPCINHSLLPSPFFVQRTFLPLQHSRHFISFILTMVKLLITLQSSDPSFGYLSCCRHCLEFSLY